MVIQLLHASNHLVINCDNTLESHIHAKELDCDFDNFNFSHDFYNSENVLNLVAVVYALRVTTLNYDYTPKLENLHFSLRAPPIYS